MCAPASDLWSGSGTVGVVPKRLTAINQVIVVTVVAEGGHFKLHTIAQDTGNIAFDASPAAVQTAMETLVGAGNVKVTGNAGGPWTAEYINDRAGKAVIVPSALSVDLNEGATLSYLSVVQGRSCFLDRD